MAKLIDKLVSKKLCTPPHWLSSNTMYLCIMGSAAYGVQTDKSDIDVYGFCIPPKRMIVQPFNDCVPGFDKMETFEHWQEHGIKDRSVHEMLEKLNLPTDTSLSEVEAEIKRRNLE